MDINEIYMKPVEACKKLGIDFNTLRSLAWDNVVTTHKVGGKTMLLIEDVERLVRHPAVIARIKARELKDTYRDPEPGKIYGLPGTSNHDVYK